MPEQEFIEAARRIIVGWDKYARPPNDLVEHIARALSSAAERDKREIERLTAELRTVQLSDLAERMQAEAKADRPTGHVEIAHDGFAGDIIGYYTTREGKRGVVVQQDGTRVVHVYGEKWLSRELEAAKAKESES